MQEPGCESIKLPRTTMPTPAPARSRPHKPRAARLRFMPRTRNRRLTVGSLSEAEHQSAERSSPRVVDWGCSALLDPSRQDELLGCNGCRNTSSHSSGKTSASPTQPCRDRARRLRRRPAWPRVAIPIHELRGRARQRRVGSSARRGQDQPLTARSHEGAGGSPVAAVTSAQIAVGRRISPLIAAVWREAEEGLRRSNAFDFDDLRALAVRLLVEHAHRLTW